MGKGHATPQPIVQEEDDEDDDKNNDGGGRGANTDDSDTSSGIDAGEAGDAQDDGMSICNILCYNVLILVCTSRYKPLRGTYRCDII